MDRRSASHIASLIRLVSYPWRTLRCFTVRLICAALLGAGLVVAGRSSRCEPSLGLTRPQFAGIRTSRSSIKRGVKPTDTSAAIGPVGGIAGTYCGSTSGCNSTGSTGTRRPKRALPDPSNAVSQRGPRRAARESPWRCHSARLTRPFVYGGLGAGGVFLAVSRGKPVLERAVGALRAGIRLRRSYGSAPSPIPAHPRLDPKPDEERYRDSRDTAGENPGRALFVRIRYTVRSGPRWLDYVF